MTKSTVRLESQERWRVAAVEALPAFRLRIRFVDGTEGIVDLADLIHSPGAEVFAALADPSLFAQAHVERGAVTWPGDLDLAPDAMYSHMRSMDSMPADGRIGVAKGKFKVPEDIDANNEEVARMFPRSQP